MNYVWVIGMVFHHSDSLFHRLLSIIRDVLLYVALVVFLLSADVRWVRELTSVIVPLK